ncbi:flagellar hook-basal body complex protein FliE [Aliidiomarina halalkaliphila]|uniref:Flagellar hook-basal body complex protein FliE n=1 Tax=Aliidiomarina halalkaliphila TaxID=2593535 RepID=A0A552X1H1_9GAMM|nr:flagellar hook-basal body complex protein FliE [Aliidiomarina halalkaliphila]TRW48825.1 flagellar hook-basal body complex protein FliE [Aliidiomarina halalkaliphila]
MSVAGIQSALQQMQALQTQATGQKPQAQIAGNQGTPGAQASFATELKSSINRINDLQNAAATKQQAFQMGDPNVALHDVMVDMQKASLAFEMGVQVRNRLVGAYKEIMNMNV